MSHRIEHLEVRAYTVPTEQPESDGTLRWDSHSIVVVRAHAAGACGTGYSYTHASVANLIDDKLRSVVEGSDAMAVTHIWHTMWHVLRSLGRPGLASTAMAAVDTALWDLKARLLGISLVDLLGPCKDAVEVYGSGGFTSYSIDQLQQQLGGWVESGISKVKMKVGRHAKDDVERVKAARAAIGNDAALMVDANGAYDRKQALGMAAQFAEHNVVWFEEPVSSDDLDGLRLVRDRAPAGMEITAGEYGYRLVYFQRMLQSGAVDVPMADATRCGGFTGFMAVAALCQAHSLPLSAHTAPQLHAHVCAALDQVRDIEYFHDHARIERMLFEHVLSPVEGSLRPDRSLPGMGIVLKEADAAPFLVWSNT